jgi:hypothetical protein
MRSGKYLCESSVFLLKNVLLLESADKHYQSGMIRRCLTVILMYELFGLNASDVEKCCLKAPPFFVTL